MLLEEIRESAIQAPPDSSAPKKPDSTKRMWVKPTKLGIQAPKGRFQHQTALIPAPSHCNSSTCTVQLHRGYKGLGLGGVFRIWGADYGLGLRVWGCLGFKAQGLGVFGVQGFAGGGLRFRFGGFWEFLRSRV